MNKQVLGYIFVICFIWVGIYFFQEKQAEESTTQVMSSTDDIEKNISNNIIDSDTQASPGNVSTDSTPDATVIGKVVTEEKPEPRFEEILYPEEYDFDALRAGPVYKKAGTKIKADFSYMLDKKLGDEVTVHFPNASITGKIVDYETDNGPEGIKAYVYRIDVNNSMQEDGSFPEQIMLSIYEQNNALIKVSGNFDTPNTDGQFYMENGIGYFATYEEYGNIAKNYKMD